ncbi:hypothetical protein QZH41_010436 [Actinostola sp. cb2023]|nr:hypothetical protein QZH41_010436 [Actinostola sp. cb2023]
MSAKQETAATADEVSTKNGEKNFNEEIKDYAKTTMNELLGMFGYDEEITSESVNNLDIKVPASAEESSTASATSFVTALPSVTVAMVTAQTSTPGVPAPVILTSSLPLTVPEDSSDDTPVIVKVEGNTSVSDIIRQQNGINTTSNANETTSVTSPEVTTATQSAQAITTQVTLPMSVAMASQSGSGQPALAPHFYAVPPAVRGLYCVVANLPLVVNQSKSAMTFKFWNCITCSEYFLQKPEVVFRVHYPHLFNGQPEWLYQAAVCSKCYYSLVTTVAPQTGTIPESLSKATFKVIDCEMEEKENSTPSCTTSVVTADVVVRTQDTQNGKKVEVKEEQQVLSVDGPKDEPIQDEDISEDMECTEESASENLESCKCYVCHISVDTASQGKLRRSKFSSLFIDVPDHVGHFKVCRMCFDRLNRQRDCYVQAKVPDEERDYYIAHMKAWSGEDIASKSCSSCTPNLCFICEATLDEKDPSRPIFRSRYPALFRGLPDHVIHVPICDKCYKKLQKVKVALIWTVSVTLTVTASMTLILTVSVTVSDSKRDTDRGSKRDTDRDSKCDSKRDTDRDSKRDSDCDSKRDSKCDSVTVNKLITGFTKPFSLNATPIASKPAAKNLSPYLQSIVQSQTNRSCTWCKQTTILKNFTFRDGTRILECRNICSQECFEMAALSIELNNENIKSIQRRIKQLRESKTSPASKCLWILWVG